MKSTILLTLIVLPFALAGPNNKARAPSPDISASIANFRSVLDSESSVISPRDTRQLNKPASRECKDLKGWKWCVSSCLELCDMICDCSSCPSNCVDRCAEKEQFRGCDGGHGH
ncbi:unnamed protein product [Fusarium graminearum]|nr:unnamed protein product [Fusarium graminearum]CAG1973030.1 unnamed protein product [Fusarium graminearum]CAG2013261.1 unnamed protein product [Fusarium graminearum]